MIIVFGFIAPLVLIALGVILNRIGLSVSAKVLSILKALLALSGFFALLKLYFYFSDYGFIRWRWLDTYPILATLILIVLVYNLGKVHFSKKEYLFFKFLQVFPISMAIVMLIPLLNLTFISTLFSYPQRYYADDEIVIQEEYTGFLAPAAPPEVYKINYGLFMQKIDLPFPCTELSDSVKVERKYNQYKVHLHGSWINEGSADSHYKERPCIYTFDLDTL